MVPFLTLTFVITNVSDCLRLGQSGPVVSLSAGFAAWPGAARPSLAPRWKPANRSRASAADRFGAKGWAPAMAPGPVFAEAGRLGSPAAAASAGDSAACEAVQSPPARDDPRPAADGAGSADGAGLADGAGPAMG